MASLKLDSEKITWVLLVSAIILLISSLFMPLVLVFIIQDYLYLSSSKWFYEAPASAYVVFMIGMQWIAFMIMLHIFIQWKFEIKMFKWITMLLMTLSIPCFMFAISNYYYLDDNGIHFNELETYNTITSYHWSDFKEAREVYTKSNGVTSLDHFELITTDNEVIELPTSSKITGAKHRILEKLNEHGVNVTNNLGDLYE